MYHKIKILCHITLYTLLFFNNDRTNMKKLSVREKDLINEIRGYKLSAKNRLRKIRYEARELLTSESKKRMLEYCKEKGDNMFSIGGEMYRFYVEMIERDKARLRIAYKDRLLDNAYDELRSWYDYDYKIEQIENSIYVDFKRSLSKYDINRLSNIEGMEIMSIYANSDKGVSVKLILS